MAHLSGTSQVSIPAMERLLAEGAGRLAAVFSPRELGQAASRSHPADYLAGHLAAKQAVIEAAKGASTGVGAGSRPLSPLDVEVVNNEAGAPGCEVAGGVAAALAEAGAAGSPRVSISNEAGRAIAIAVVPLHETNRRKDPMDEQDRAVAEKLRRELEATGARLALGDEVQAAAEKAPAGSDPSDGMDPTGLLAGPFAEAMRAYRRAKASGDPAATAEAERRLQEVVRAEMVASESCPDNGGNEEDA